MKKTMTEDIAGGFRWLREKTEIMKQRWFPLGKPWFILLGVLTAIGFLLWIFHPLVLPVRLREAVSVIPQNHWNQLLALYAFSIVTAQLVIQPTLIGVRLLFGLFCEEDVLPQNLWPAALVGICESVMYPTSFIYGKPEFIGIWLALKVAGQWDYWHKEHSGRNRYQMFLLGNAMSVSFGFLTYGLVVAFVM